MVIKDKINIVCVGSNLESMVCLKNFKENNILISGLVTLPFRELSRGSDYRDLIPFCEKNDIPFYRTSEINSFETKKWLNNIKPDYIFVLGWSQIFDDEMIDLPNHFIIGSHPSDLPYGAGRAPVVWTILEDLRESAVSFFKMTKKVDAGNLLLKKYFKIPERSNSTYLYNLVSKNLSAGFIELYYQILGDNFNETKQDFSIRTVRPRRSFEDGEIDFKNAAEDVDRLIRAATEPYPGAFSFYENERYTFWQSELSQNNHYNGIPGEILKMKDNQILVKCLDSAIWLFDLSDSQGKPTSTNIFKIGTQFGLNL